MGYSYRPTIINRNKFLNINTKSIADFIKFVYEVSVYLNFKTGESNTMILDLGPWT